MFFFLGALEEVNKDCKEMKDWQIMKWKKLKVCIFIHILDVAESYICNSHFKC